MGHLFAQILVPLDNRTAHISPLRTVSRSWRLPSYLWLRTGTFWFSRLFRIMESLEKHSGVSCSYNLAHKAQQFLPFAQMPHHHDWHHEGHKGCNYTFSSIGGFWDCAFGTRKSGRYEDNTCATPRDKARLGPSRGRLPRWFHPLLPVFGMGCAVVAKLWGR